MAIFTGRIKAGFENVQYLRTGATVDYASPVDRSSPVFSRDITGLAALTSADVFFRREFTIASNASITIDLNGTGNEDTFGDGLNMVTMVCLMVINAPVDDGAAANTTNLTVGAGSNPVVGYKAGTTPTEVIRPGGVYLVANISAGGVATVTAGTADIITIANALGASAKMQICVMGRSA